MMTRLVGIAFGSVLALLALPAVAEDQATQDRSAAEALVRDMFAKKIRELERVVGKGAEQFAKRCDYLRKTFETPLLVGTDERCRPIWGDNFRFPNLSSEDLMYMDDANELPKSRIIESGVKGDAAVVKVQAPIAKDLPATRIVYFLKKSEDRWRISNILAYSEWPLDINREGGCKDASGYYHYALPPRSASDLEDLPRACKELELRNRPELGKAR